jgi:hypothetical protein
MDMRKSCPPPNLTPEMGRLDREANLAPYASGFSTPRKGVVVRKARPEEAPVRGNKQGAETPYEQRLAQLGTTLHPLL